jgi:hypothetical protein
VTGILRRLLGSPVDPCAGGHDPIRYVELDELERLLAARQSEPASPDARAPLPARRLRIHERCPCCGKFWT